MLTFLAIELIIYLRNDVGVKRSLRVECKEVI